MNTLVAQIAVMAAVCALVLGARAHVSAAWDQDADGVWSAPGNWAGGVAPTGTTGVATFGNAITASCGSATAPTLPPAPGAALWRLAAAALRC